MNPAHRNLCEHADSLHDLRRLWDADLQKSIKRRQWSEFVGFLLLVGVMVAVETGRGVLAVGMACAAVAFLYAAVKHMIDESNTNYLIHQWDLNEALERLKATSRAYEQA